MAFEENVAGVDKGHAGKNLAVDKREKYR